MELAAVALAQLQVVERLAVADGPGRGAPWREQVAAAKLGRLLDEAVLDDALAPLVDPRVQVEPRRRQEYAPVRTPPISGVVPLLSRAPKVKHCTDAETYTMVYSQ